MRLLSRGTDGSLELVSFDGDQPLPPYAILSHTWSSDDADEVTYNDITTNPWESFDSSRDLSKSDSSSSWKIGYRKIEFCSRQAAKDGLSHFWIDTCCIDKQNNDELSEAITSMFRWYQKATKCYVYLSDVHLEPSLVPEGGNWKHDLRRSRWFTRGWTLQELLAPQEVAFFASKGEMLGTRSRLKNLISQITSIDTRLLESAEKMTLVDVSVEKRLSWAVKRRTTRIEDRAYSLLGIFGVEMPIRYGEGTAALLRFEAAILRKNKDEMGFECISRLNDDRVMRDYQNTQRIKQLTKTDHRAYALVGPRYDRGGGRKEHETDEKLRMQNALKWVAKLPVLRTTWQDPNLPSESAEDASQRLERTSEFQTTRSTYSSLVKEAWCERTEENPGGVLDHDLRKGRHETIESPVMTHQLAIESWKPRYERDDCQADFKPSSWHQTSCEAHVDLKFLENEETKSEVSGSGYGTVDDSESSTASSDWSSSNVTWSNCSNDKDEMVLNMFVDVLVEQITQRACFSASILDSVGDIHSAGHQADQKIVQGRLDTCKGYKRKAEDVDSWLSVKDNRDSHWKNRALQTAE